MSIPTTPAVADEAARKRDLIIKHEVSASRAARTAKQELRQFALEDVRRILDYLEPLPEIPGNWYPCGPVFYKHRQLHLWIRGIILSAFLIAGAVVLPLQLGAGLAFVCKGRFSALWRELPAPTRLMIDGYRSFSDFVKAPLDLVLRVGPSAGRAVRRPVRAVQHPRPRLRPHVACLGRDHGLEVANGLGPSGPV